jgi:hypothetical protein
MAKFPEKMLFFLYKIWYTNVQGVNPWDYGGVYRAQSSGDYLKLRMKFKI